MDSTNTTMHRRPRAAGRIAATLAAAVIALTLMPAAALAQPAEAVEYTVKNGDSLSRIAIDHGFTDPDAWRVLYDANEEIADPDVILPGQVLRIPAAGEEVPHRPLPDSAPAPAAAAADETATDSAEQTTSEEEAPAEAEPAPEPEPEPEPAPAAASGSGVWDQLAACESGGNWAANTGNGYYGGLQFSASSWQAVGGSGLPHQHSRETQIAMGERLLAAQGWGAWPACSSELGLR